MEKEERGEKAWRPEACGRRAGDPQEDTEPSNWPGETREWPAPDHNRFFPPSRMNSECDERHIPLTNPGGPPYNRP